VCRFFCLAMWVWDDITWQVYTRCHLYPLCRFIASSTMVWCLIVCLTTDSLPPHTQICGLPWICHLLTINGPMRDVDDDGGSRGRPMDIGPAELSMDPPRSRGHSQPIK
jgi:hypothetical protein